MASKPLGLHALPKIAQKVRRFLQWSSSDFLQPANEKQRIQDFSSRTIRRIVKEGGQSDDPNYDTCATRLSLIAQFRCGFR